MTGSKRLHRRFLGREASGQVGYGIAALRTIGDLPIREDTAQEPLSVSFECGGDTRDVGDINAQSEDSHGSAPA